MYLRKYLLGVAVLASATAGAEDPWLEVTTSNFVVLSNAGEDAAKSVARELERIRTVFRAAAAVRRASRDRVRVYVVGDDESLARLVPEYGPGAPPGLFRSTLGREDIVLKTGSPNGSSHTVLYHEYFHHLSRLDAPGMPLWLQEGLAELWGHTAVRGARAEVGLPSRSHLELLRTEELIPLSILLVADRESPTYRDPAKKGLFYAQSWILTHYLMLSGGRDHRLELDRYLAAVKRGEDRKEAWRRTFGDLSDFETRLAGYARRESYAGIQLKVPTEIEEPILEVEKLSEAEAKAAQADFLVWGPSYPHAEPLARRAFELAPDLPLVKEVLGALELKRRREGDAWKWFAEASTSPEASHLAHYYAATLAPPEERFDVEASLLRAIDARPSFAPAYVELAYHYAGLGALPQALATVEMAAELSPDSAWHRSLVARALRRMGRIGEARKTIQEAVGLALASGRADEASLLCRFGSLAGMADWVLPACDRAVAVDPGVGAYRDSRAVARAILGDREGAVADFRAFLAFGGAELAPEATARRRAWIRELEGEREPFDARAREELLGRPF